MQIKNYAIAILGCSLSINAMADSINSPSNLFVLEDQRWLMIGSLGFTWYGDLYDGGHDADPSHQHAIGDGKTALGRFAIGTDVRTFRSLRIGAEIGVQSGDTARLDIPQVVMDDLGGILPLITIKPMLDFLLTATFQPVASVPIFAVIKPGVAFRRLQVDDRVTFNDIAEAAFEIQVGLGTYLTPRATLSLNYQGIFDGHTTYTVDTTTFTGHISHIPEQNGVLLSLTYTV